MAFAERVADKPLAEKASHLLLKKLSNWFPRWVAVSIVYLTLLAGLVGAGLIIGLKVVSQIQTLVSLIPVYLDNLRALTENIALKLGTEQPELLDCFFDTQALTSWIIVSGQQFLVQSYGLTRGLIGAVLNLVLALLLSAYMIADSENLIKGIVNLFPQPWDERLSAQVIPISQRMGGYIQGRVLVSGILGVAITLGLGILGLSEFALALGVIAGFINLIPFIGPVLGAIPALIVALSQGGLTFFLGISIICNYPKFRNLFIRPITGRFFCTNSPTISTFGSTRRNASFRYH